MKQAAMEALGAVYKKIPPDYRPGLKRLVFGTLLKAQGAATGRRIHYARRVEFLDFEIAHLEPYKFLSPGKNDVLVEMECSTLSPGTERAVLCGLPGARKNFPYQPGYSSAGTVVKSGAKSSFQVGERVAGRIKHVSHDTVSPELLFRIPNGVSFEEASFIELGIITLQGIRKAAIRPGERVAVIGQGIIGQMANRLARLLFPARVLAVAPSSNRRSTALASGGAHEFISLRETPSYAEVIAADVVIEAVGTPQAIDIAMKCAKPGGRVVLLGSSRGLSRDVDLWNVAQRRSLDIIGAHITAIPEKESSTRMWTYRREGELFLRLLEKKRLSVSELVTWRARPEECNMVYEILSHGGDRHVGIVFHWKSGDELKTGIAAPKS